MLEYACVIHTVQLFVLQVTDAMNRHGVKILSVQGQCVSSDCDPCSCERATSVVDVFGAFQNKTIALGFIKGEGKDRQTFLYEFFHQCNWLSVDYSIALWVGQTIPRNVRIKFVGDLQRKEDCKVSILPVNGFPWKGDSRERKIFCGLLHALLHTDVSILASMSHACIRSTLYTMSLIHYMFNVL